MIPPSDPKGNGTEQDSGLPEAHPDSVKVLRPMERYVWLMQYIQAHGQVDVLHSDFVDDYTAATRVKATSTCWGAFKCPTLGKDLAHMAKCGALKRGRIGLSGNWQPGFPKWVWAYSEGSAAYLYAPEQTGRNARQGETVS